MKQRDIYWANLDPTVGKEQQGKRPVVIISGNTMNSRTGIYIACAISSKIKNYPGCVLISKSKKNGLKHDSEILSFQIRTLSGKRFGKKIGEISENELSQIYTGLTKIFKY
jgi:mRNA interferase MazF